MKNELFSKTNYLHVTNLIPNESESRQLAQIVKEF